MGEGGSGAFWARSLISPYGEPLHPSKFDRAWMIAIAMLAVLAALLFLSASREAQVSQKDVRELRSR